MKFLKRDNQVPTKSIVLLGSRMVRVCDTVKQSSSILSYKIKQQLRNSFGNGSKLPATQLLSNNKSAITDVENNVGSFIFDEH